MLLQLQMFFCTISCVTGQLGNDDYLTTFRQEVNCFKDEIKHFIYLHLTIFTLIRAVVFHVTYPHLPFQLFYRIMRGYSWETLSMHNLGEKSR